MRRPTRVKHFFSRPGCNALRRPAGGATAFPLFFHIRNLFASTSAESPCFHSHSLVERFAPAPVGVLNFESGAALSESNCTPRLPSAPVPPRPRSHPNSAMVFTKPLLAPAPGNSARARTPPRTPTAGAIRFPACAPPPQSPASWHSCRRGPTTLIPSVQIRVRSPMSQDVMGPLHQQLPQIPVAFLGDAQLGLALATLAAFRPQSHITTHIPALGESLRIFHG